MYKPILIDYYEQPEIGNIILRDCDDKLCINTKDIQYHGNQKHIIIIDTEAEIVKNDWCLCNFKTGIEIRQNIYGKIGSTIGSEKYLKEKCDKIISSTEELDSLIIQDKDRNGKNKGIRSYSTLPQLSPQSIQLLINYYNEYKCMPENVDVELGTTRDCSIQLSKEFNYIKLNQQGEVDIIIPEKPLYQQIIDVCGGEVGFCKAANIVTFEVEESLYTEKEVKDLCLACMSLSMGLRQNQLNGYCGKSGKEVFNEWFELNKKK